MDDQGSLWEATERQFCDDIRSSILQISKLRDQLPETPSVAILREFTVVLTRLAETLYSAVHKQQHPFYHFIQRSKERQRTLTLAVNALQSAARQYERYRRSPSKYATTEASVSLHKVLVALENLCPDGKL